VPAPDVQCGARQRRRRVASCRRSTQTVRDVPDEQHPEKPGEAHPQARGPLVDSERLERGGGDPVLEWWLLEVLEAVEARREPVTARRHFARDLGIARLVGTDQLAMVEIREPEQGKQDREADRCRWSGPGVVQPENR